MGKREGAVIGGIRGKEGSIGRKERGIGGFILYGGLIWGMWGVQ